MYHQHIINISILMPNGELMKMVQPLFIVRHLLHMQVTMKLNREKTELFSVLCILYCTMYICLYRNESCTEWISRDKVWFTNKVYCRRGNQPEGNTKNRWGVAHW